MLRNCTAAHTHLRALALIAALCVALAAPAVAPAATLSLAPGGADSGNCQAAACGSFAYAYAQAASGDVIEVGAGTYNTQTVPSGSTAVTFHGAPGNKVRGISNHASNVTFDGIDSDGGGQKVVAFYNGGGANVTFRHGSIGNVVDEKGALVDGDNMVYDDVVFHDVVQRGADVHNECMFVMVPEKLVIRNSVFRNCATMDINMNWPGYWNPQPPAYGSVTLENNIFGHSVNGSGWHAYGLVIGGTGPNSGVPSCANGQKASVYLRGWRVVNNTFENAVIVGDGDNGCGDGTSVWANNIGDGWLCMSGVTFAGNVGKKCGSTDKAATLASSWFVDAPHWDFHLTANAAAVNAGSASYATTTDRDGKYRDGRPDAGAYEQGVGGDANSLAHGGSPPVAQTPTNSGSGTPTGNTGPHTTLAIESARVRSATICRRARRGCPTATRLVLRVAGATRASVRLERIRPGRKARRIRTWTFRADRTTRIRARGLAAGRYRLRVVAIGGGGTRSVATFVRFRVR